MKVCDNVHFDTRNECYDDAAPVAICDATANGTGSVR